MLISELWASIFCGRILHAREGERLGRVVVSTAALVAVLVDLFLNLSRVEVRIELWYLHFFFFLPPRDMK